MIAAKATGAASSTRKHPPRVVAAVIGFRQRLAAFTVESSGFDLQQDEVRCQG
jgi:hypothetical protein